MEALKEDSITYLEIARLGMMMVGDENAEEMDLSDEEFLRLREQLEEHMEGKKYGIQDTRLKRRY